MCKNSVFKGLSLLIILLVPLGSFAQLNKYVDDTVQTNWVQTQWVDSVLFDSSLPSEDRWWQNFNDTTLDNLIIEAVENNYDVLMAADRIDQAKASMRISQSGFYPHLAVSASYMPGQQSADILGTDRGVTNPGIATVDMSWEVDIVGSIRKKARASKEMFMATESEFNGILVALCANLASVYVSLRTTQQQLNVANVNLISQLSVLVIAEARYSAGLVSALDVAQAKTVYESTKAIIPGLEAQTIAYCNAISTLLGEPAGYMRARLSEIQPLPNPPATIAVGVPMDFMRQRPDITVAEKSLLSKAALLGATKAEWGPKFYIDGSFGYGSNNFENFTDNKNMIWQIGPSMRWNIFTGLQVSQSTKMAKAELEESVSYYRQTVLNAFEDVDNAMVFYSKSLEQIRANSEAVVQAELTLDLSLDLYTQGLADFQNVLDAQRYLLSYQTAYVSSQGASLQQLVSLYKALGGGWQTQNN